VLTPEERESFKGITIEDTEFRSHGGQNRSETGRRVYMKRIHLGTGSLLERIAWGLVIVGLIMVALPLLFFILGAVFLGWMLSRAFRRYR